MRKMTVLGFVLAAALSTPALAQSFLGDWTATAHAPGGDVSETIRVTKTGDGYAVEPKADAAQPAGPQAGPGTNVVLDGNRFSYTRSIPLQGGAIAINYAGVVSGDTFAGTAQIAGSKVPYTGVRLAAGQ